MYSEEVGLHVVDVSKVQDLTCSVEEMSPHTFNF